MELGKKDILVAQELFDLLDDGDGGIHTGEFFHGLARMKGGRQTGRLGDFDHDLPLWHVEIVGLLVNERN